MKEKTTQKANKIYLDYASATPVAADVALLVKDTLMKCYGNAGSLHKDGVTAKKIIDGAKRESAQALFAHPDEIIFTSGATESNNLAIRGTVLAFKNTQKFAHKKPHIIVSNIEHASVLEVCQALVKEKIADVTYISVDKEGIIDPKKIAEAIKPETVLISIMYANNEIGVIEPIKEIAKVIRHYRKDNAKKFPVFHTDGAQATNYLDMNVERLGVDLMTVSSGKIYGPKGVGLLYIRRKTPISAIIFGGGQENGLRSGTENTPLIAGFGLALKVARKISEKESIRLTKLRDWLIKELEKNFEGVIINGSKNFRLPNNINITLPKYESEELVLRLDAKGFSISAKSACDSGNNEESHVLSAIGKREDSKIGSLRITLGRNTSKKDLEKFLIALTNSLKVMLIA